jgi:UDP-N-acetylenolpyruvoylglucosamine reductase, C-terminal domain
MFTPYVVVAAAMNTYAAYVDHVRSGLWSNANQHRRSHHHEASAASSATPTAPRLPAPSTPPGRKGSTSAASPVCQRHTNFIRKAGKASATDVRGLIELVANWAHADSGLRLQPEIASRQLVSTLEQPPLFHDEKGAASP